VTAFKCGWVYPNKGGCGKTAKFYVSRPGMHAHSCASHLSGTVRKVEAGSKQKYVEVEVVK
jgi:hypothetical protein